MARHSNCIPFLPGTGGARTARRRRRGSAATHIRTGKGPATGAAHEVYADQHGVRAGNYRAFSAALATYEEWLRLRVGRWVQRYPEAQAKVGGDLLIGDLVEEVYLNAFEGWVRRPTEVGLGWWLESSIDPSLRALLRHPAEVKENASLARTLREAPLS